jgi:hypothetical protein
MPSKKKIVSKLLPVTRSVRRLHDLGWIADIAERKMGKLSRDWCNFADIVAIRVGHNLSPQVLLVQATGWTNVSSRLTKVRASREALRCVMAGCSVQVWGWDRCREEPRIEHVKLDSFDDFPPTCVE